MFNPYIDIDLDALLHNYGEIRKLAPKSHVLAMIKANAYGHGAVMCAKTLADADAFGVIRIPEALELRHAAVKNPVILMGGVMQAGDLDVIAAYDIGLVVHDLFQVEMLEQYRGDATFTVWLKLDTGMSRLGFRDADVQKAYLRLKQCVCVRQPFTVMSHLVAPELPDSPLTDQQLAVFMKQVSHWPEEKSLAKSAAILTRPDTHLDWVRPGLMLYGISPFADKTGVELGLKPVMTFKTRLVRVDKCKKGDNIGYGAQTTAPEDMPIGIAAVGYADGYPRHITGPAPVLVNGQAAFTIGRIAMDLMMIDLRTVGKAAVGDEVTLWGEGAPIEQVATLANTTPYTLTTAVSARVQRRYASAEMEGLKRAQL